MTQQNMSKEEFFELLPSLPGTTTNIKCINFEGFSQLCDYFCHKGKIEAFKEMSERINELEKHEQ